MLKLESSFLLLFYCLGGLIASSQVEISGRVLDKVSGSYLQNVSVRIGNTKDVVFTDKAGYFKFINVTEKATLLIFELAQYNSLRIPIERNLTLQKLDLGSLRMSRTESFSFNDYLAELNENDIEENQNVIDNFAGILSAGKDLFSRTSAYDFGSNFFRPRFLGTEHGVVMLNGVVLNKIYSGRPEWSNWGGLNDALRLQERYDAMQVSSYALGGLSSGINMISSASRQKGGLKLSLAASNKNYQSRVMTTYSSRSSKGGWSYMFSASVRLGIEGFRSGTNYQGYSLLTSIDKKIGQKHHLNTTFIYALNKKGKSSPMTQEVFELKNIRYNSYWGYQQNQIRNSREKKIIEPIFQLNYRFDISKNTSIHHHFTYQTGTIASSRLDYGGSRLLDNGQTIVGGGMNPDPTYYQKLPSFFLRNSSKPDFGRAYLAEKEFIENGQIDWKELYEANTNFQQVNNSVYALYDDKRESEFWSLNSGFSTKLAQKIALEGVFSVAGNNSESFAYMLDLLGGKGYLDIDPYADNLSDAQNDLRFPNRIVSEQEKFRYNYQLHSRQIKVFLKTNYTSKKTDIYFGTDFESVNFQRTGLYENGAYPGPLSFGKSTSIDFQSFGVKTGISHQFNGRHILVMNLNYLGKTPVLNHVFSNVRVSNDIVKGLKSYDYKGIDFKYLWRHARFKATFSGFYLLLADESKISFYYADGLTGIEGSESSAYVQEVLTGIDKQNMGFEFSIEVPVFRNFKIKGVAAVGSSVYASDPELYLTSNDINGTLNLGRSFLKNYHATGGPERVYSMGFEYSSPQYWWFSTSFNYFDRTFLAVAPITRTKNFILDTDGLPINDIDQNLARELLRQESLRPYFNLNVVGGKSWKINELYLGLFLSINNLSNSHYKRGGFEQSRTANYTTLKEDKSRNKPLFGPKYWFGFGTTFFTSFYIRL